MPSAPLTVPPLARCSQHEAGCTAIETKAGGFSAEQMAAGGFSTKELHSSGFSAKTLKGALYACVD